jgi:hypothetical protein
LRNARCLYARDLPDKPALRDEACHIPAKEPSVNCQKGGHAFHPQRPLCVKAGRRVSRRPMSAMGQQRLRTPALPPGLPQEPPSRLPARRSVRGQFETSLDSWTTGQKKSKLQRRYDLQWRRVHSNWYIVQWCVHPVTHRTLLLSDWRRRLQSAPQ